jgi:predicted nucleic acid-binding protein
MNVYVESGFVLTLALQQRDFPAAAAVLTAAKQHRITLKIPVFSLSEPFSTVQYRANTRHRLVDELTREIRELERTQLHEEMARELRGYPIQMAQILQTHLDAVERVTLELSQSCDLLPLDATVLRRAAGIRAPYDLRPPDAIILATILLDLERTPAPIMSLFASQNVKDFEHPLIRDELSRLRCTYLGDFPNVVRIIERRSTKNLSR